PPSPGVFLLPVKRLWIPINLVSLKYRAVFLCNHGTPQMQKHDQRKDAGRKSFARNSVQANRKPESICGTQAARARRGQETSTASQGSERRAGPHTRPEARIRSDPQKQRVPTTSITSHTGRVA